MHDSLIPTGPAEELDPAMLVSIVERVSERELGEAMRSPTRTAVLDEIFRRMPDRLSQQQAQGVEAVIHWRIGDRADGGEDVYEVTVRDGECHVAKQPSETPRVTLKIKPAAFLRLIAGKTSGMKLVLGRKLTVEGDVPFAMRVERLFERY
jgi:putative sterol carrier protein